MPNTVSLKRLLEVDRAVLEQVSLEQQNKIYLQTIDPRRMQIDQIVGKVESKGPDSLYYPSEEMPELSLASIFPQSAFRIQAFSILIGRSEFN